METAHGGNELPQQLNPNNLQICIEGINLILSRWTALQMAVQNEWGGRLSRQKSENLASDILNFFAQSKGPLYIDVLEDLLFVNTGEYLNMVVEDGSIEEVAEELMILHDELLHDTFNFIEKLRKSKSASDSVAKSRAVATNMDETDGESSGDEASDMTVDEPSSRLAPKSEIMRVDEQQLQQQPETVEVEDGWTVVPSRRNQGKRR
ncbi:hypothetical protein IFM89_032519 [Coptis chinensis]|uniref:Pre-rRNA-processing protein TSR2 homolog n=1 Tax=Coptis chinensis TaxID=261450 RepID=A0A835IRP2_9MAGN|nr:hypothetical protein IFM89_032519 [Coptis chinensis]